MAEPTKVKKKVPPKPQSQQEKKKKGPSKPQPAWLFPPDEENPVLNPKEKSHAEVDKAIKEREKAVDYMQRRVHGVPDRLAPDPLLLTLIGIFLTDFGFNSTSRLFTNERQARQTLNGWEEALGKKIDKNTPKLEQIFRDWHRDWLVKQGDDTSSSDTSSEAASDEDSSSSRAGSDVDMQDAPQPKPKKVKKPTKSTKVASTSSSASSSGSDSDADDEKENTELKAEPLVKKVKQAIAAVPTVGAMVNKLKRKAPSSSSDSASDHAEEEKPAKIKKSKTESLVPTDAPKAKGSKATKAKEKAVTAKSAKSAKGSKDVKPKTPPVRAASPPSSSSDTSDSESDDADNSNPKQGAPLPPLRTASSDSSATIDGDSKKPSTNASPSSHSHSSSSATSSSSSDSDAAAPPPSKKASPPPTKAPKAKKHTGAKLTPLAEKSRAADPEGHPSNRYHANSYADKAYQDLSVTRGKGFTKEKNKKKRGSYRGGAIDMNASSNSFKFED
jgi:SRP40, C-terminal domain